MRNTLSTLFVFLFLVGCAARPEVDSIADAIVVTAADIETAAQQIGRACGNTEPDGPCAPGALISTSDKDRLAEDLQEALDSLLLANQALAADEGIEADNRLARAKSLLLIVRTALDSAN